MANVTRQPPEGVKLVGPGEPEPEEELSEEQQILFEGGGGAEVNPASMVEAANARVMGTQLPVSTRTLRMLPVMRHAAKDPSLPPAVRDMYRTVVLSIEAKLRNRG